MIYKKVEYFVKTNGFSPFEHWFNGLETPVQAIVARIIQRVATGGAKKSVKALKDGMFEIKIPTGPGYRVYFAETGKDVITLFIGGDKNSQNRDIKKAKEYWRDYYGK